ncbi:hypothetical protein GF373_15085 [bacterium]|nr:hypothetical protein [bacterium]
MTLNRHISIGLIFFFSLANHVVGTTYEVGPDTPLTVDQAIDAAAPGDIIYLDGGRYMLDHSITIAKSGTQDNPISLVAAPGETPILDFRNNPRHANRPQPRDNDSIAATGDAVGLLVTGDWWHIKGLTVYNAPYYGVRVYGSNNIFEQLSLTKNHAAGLEITGKDGRIPSHNLVLNCDSYLNSDRQTNGEDADGFAAKFETLGPGNVFRGCRAWYNSDDGFDFWHAANPVLVEHTWVFENGWKRDEFNIPSGTYRGDGMGFKLGQDASRITLNNVVAWHNKGFGIDDNGNRNPKGCIINHATVINNAKYFSIQVSLNDGQPHTIKNSIAFEVSESGFTEFRGNVDDTHNTWNGMPVSKDDFLSFDSTLLFKPRNADGTLPVTQFLRLTPDSNLVDAGVDVGLPYHGSAPDLGAFELTDEPLSNVVDWGIEQ